MDIVLETDRLSLRRFTEGDTDLLVELDGDPEVMRYLNGGRPTKRTRVETHVLPTILGEYGRHPGFGVFAAHVVPAGEFVGWFMLRPHDAPGEVELGYRLRQPAWGKGYATEGSRALIRRAFTELGARRVVAETMAVNTSSRRVMEKVGLRHELTYHPPYAPIEGSEHGEVRYVLGRDAWAEAASQRKDLHGSS